MRKIKEKRKYLLISVENKKQGTGSDFYLELINYFAGEKFSCHNTLKYGHALLLFYELFLLFFIPAGARIVTTWPGFPRQFLVFDGLSNRTRFRIVQFIARIRKWEITLLPVDLPLKQFNGRLSERVILKQGTIEREYFSTIKSFLTCGSGMTGYFRMNFPEKKTEPFDLYCQNLPGIPDEKPQFGSQGTVKIVISGNLKRMAGDLNILPAGEKIEYYFTGPNGEEIERAGRPDFNYLGLIDESNLVKVLSGFDFGLIYYSPDESEYFSLVIAGKLTTYLLAGLPIICPSRYTSMSELVIRRKIGIVISEYNEIEHLVDLKQDEYKTITYNCLSMASLIRTGSVYREVLSKVNLV